MAEVNYNGDERYPGPEVFPLPDFISGTPTQAELDAQPRLFTWGELKEIIKSGQLEYLSRNKELQARYDKWIALQKEIWGSTESYLINARLPWRSTGHDPIEPTYDQRTALDHPEVDLTPSTNPHGPKKRAPPPPPLKSTRTPGSGAAIVAAHALGRSASGGLVPTPPSPHTPSISCVATAASTPAGSGASTPSSVAYVSLESVLPRVNKALARRKERDSRRYLQSEVVDGLSNKSTGPNSSLNVSPDLSAGDEDSATFADPDDPAHDVFLRWDGHLDPEKYAILPNDWPYCVPYGVRHYCIWSRIPIAHPVLVNYDPKTWHYVEANGLGGFTGVVPVLRDCDASGGEDSSSEDVGDSGDENDHNNTLPPERPFTPSSPRSPISPTSPNTLYNRMPSTPPPPVIPPPGSVGRAGPAEASKGGWYAIDTHYGGRDMRRWAGVTFESNGGKEVGRMVRGLWDERGWETIWFVNPAHLQSVPGFSHFHIFARRKTPPEIDISEQVYAARDRRKMKRAESSKKRQEEREARKTREAGEEKEKVVANGALDEEESNDVDGGRRQKAEARQ